jgi:O-antigen/teichoic acid export membrane protein
MDRVTTATVQPNARQLPPVLGRLLSGTFWLALRTPLQAIFTLWTTRLVLGTIGDDAWGAYRFAWGFGFFQFLLEFGMGSALQRRISETYTRGDRAAVDRAIACGMNFYAGMALVQAAALMAVAYGALPHSRFFGKPSYSLVVRLLWLQALTAPCYGLSMVVVSVLQAARRYDFIPRLEVVIVILRFAILWAGLNAGFDFFAVVVAMTLVQVILSLGPAIWVMVRELGHVPRFGRVGRDDYAALMHISFFMFLLQLSVVLSDKVDTTILGFVLSDPGHANTVYDVVSKAFLQIRQTGWMLASMVMPVVAGLAAARDETGLDRMKYDGPRLHIGVLLPVALLAWIYAGPFLALWVGDRPGIVVAREAPLMRLFLVATLPMALWLSVQVAIGMGRVEVVAVSALAGALINLPLSYVLTVRLGVAGVIWGTVLTTLISNLLVPGVYIFRVLGIRVRTYLSRTLGAPLAGAAALVAATWAFRLLVPIEPRGTTVLERSVPLLVHLTVGTLAYLAGYLAVPHGRADLAALIGAIRRRSASAG